VDGLANNSYPDVVCHNACRLIVVDNVAKIAGFDNVVPYKIPGGQKADSATEKTSAAERRMQVAYVAYFAP